MLRVESIMPVDLRILADDQRPRIAFLGHHGSRQDIDVCKRFNLRRNDHCSCVRILRKGEKPATTGEVRGAGIIG